MTPPAAISMAVERSGERQPSRPRMSARKNTSRAMKIGNEAMVGTGGNPSHALCRATALPSVRISGEPSAQIAAGCNVCGNRIPDRCRDIGERHELHRRIAVYERRSPGNGCKAAQQGGAAIARCGR